ncbi:FMN-binding protein [Eggerthella sinensis]|uniref:FMN-binding protein n=1 Tax=Eggerthella sinensis TaxID=242230 RepID=UPI0022E06FBD|nr:FMN-binding protein [Eggerthella sinensis]
MIKNRNEIEAEQRYAQTMARIAGNVRRSLTLDRRGFVKGSFAVGLFAALGAGLAGCAPGGGSDESAKAAAAFTPGSYAATGTGRNAEISITCTFDEGKLTDIAYEEDESRNIGDEACRMLKERYLAAQNLNVDSISGATMTSMAFSAAVADCWKQAGGDVSKAQKAASALPAAEAVEETCDVCVVGSGGAALAAP